MKLFTTVALLFLAAFPAVHAHDVHSYYKTKQPIRSAVKAKVINSTPVYKYVTVSKPQRYCELAEPLKTHNNYHNGDAVIVGGIVGGVIGHATSHKRHKGLGTIAGAVIGSALGHNLERAHSSGSDNYLVQQQKCLSSYKKSSKVRVLDGYKVTYRSAGQLYRIFVRDNPGKYIRIFY